MTNMTGPDCAVMCNLINTCYIYIYIPKPFSGGFHQHFSRLFRRQQVVDLLSCVVAGWQTERRYEDAILLLQLLVRRDQVTLGTAYGIPARVDFFFFFNLTYSRWTSLLPSCLWSQRIFPSLPGSRLTIFYRDASSALLQLVNQWLNFTYSLSHAFRYERKNTNPALVRIELTTSALAGVQVAY